MAEYRGCELLLLAQAGKEKHEADSRSHSGEAASVKDILDALEVHSGSQD